MKKMTCVFHGERNKRTVGGKEKKEEICADVGKNRIVEREQLLGGLIRKIHKLIIV